MSGRKKQSSISRFFAKAASGNAEKKQPAGQSPAPKRSKCGESSGASPFFGAVASPTTAGSEQPSQQAPSSPRKHAPISPKAKKAVEALSGFLPSKRAKGERGSTPSKVLDSSQETRNGTTAAKRRVELSPQKDKLDVNTFLRPQRKAKGQAETTGLPGFQVPKGAKLTPLEKQFLDVKRKYPSAVLLVEVGYKYQFFGQDAEIAAKVLNIFCHSGHNNFKMASIPVPRLFVHVRRLVDAGYKVGVVKQTETAALKKASANKSKPFTRELAAMYTKGTLIGEDVEASDTSADLNETGYLCCIAEKPKDEAGEHTSIGLVAVNCTTGDMIYDEFEDDVSRGKLDTRLTHIGPVEVLAPVQLSGRTSRLVRSLHAAGLREERIADEHFDVTRAASAVTDFFSTHAAAPPASADPDEDSKSVPATSAQRNATLVSAMLALPPLVLACMAALLRHLRDFRLERILTLSSALRRFSTTGRELVLNACTLKNLDILREQATGGQQGSLLWLLDHTTTPFGRRLLRQWVSRPLLSAPDILERQRTVELFSTAFSTGADDLRALLSSLPDLERGLVSIYSQRCSPRELWALVTALSRVRNHFIHLKAHSVLQKSKLLTRLVQTVCDAFEAGDKFVGLMSKKAAQDNDKVNLLVDCEALFPTKAPLEERVIVIQQELFAHKRSICRTLGLNAFEYSCVSGEEYLIEVSRSRTSVVPKDWMTISATKQKVRYRSPYITQRLELLAQCKEQLQIDAAEAWRKFMESFSLHYDDLRRGTKALATLDCLLSLAHTAKLPGYIKPTLLDTWAGSRGDDGTGPASNAVGDRESPGSCNGGSASERMTGCNGGDDSEFVPRLQIVKGRHPMVSAALDDQFVPNSTEMDGDGVRCMVITGPNMGGKSSYIKQVGLLVIMAQLGCYVPAEGMELTLFNSIFTRMGASDDIQRGQSTFMTELREASEALRSATPRSLVIMDELGRGTSTHDGVAIAHATLKHLIQKVRCLSLFVTHYPSLAEVAALYPRHVLCTHMSFVEESSVSGSKERREGPDDSDGDSTTRILFLHQLVKGLAKKSYGLNVARLACLPEGVLARAAEKSRDLEIIVQARRSKEQQSNMEAFARALAGTEDPHSAVNLLSAVQHYKA